MPRRKVLRLSPLEHKVMNVVWERGVVTADDVRGGAGPIAADEGFDCPHHLAAA